jgi:dTDP-4-amino-4,6-dideoxygalactose transaminase
VKIIPNNLQRQFSLYANEFEQKAIDVLRSGWYILGKETSEFEKEFAAYIGAAHCVGLASGLDALWISMKLLGIGVGDEVIVCANAYIACVMGISINGAIPVFVEPDVYQNIDADKIECAITAKTKAILAVHLFGQSCNMTKIMDIAKKHKLIVVEDCAQSHGSAWDNKKTGTFGNIGCFSFYPTKGLGAFGDAGAVVTNDPVLADKVRVFRNYGSKVRYQNEVIGANSRLDEMQAGLLRVKLEHLDEINSERTKIAKYYLDKIKNPLITLPQTCSHAFCTWHQFVVRCKYRDDLIKWLKDDGIGSIIHYPIPPYLSEAYKGLGYQEGAYPITEQYASEVLSLPMYNGMTLEEQDFVINKINNFTKVMNI